MNLPAASGRGIMMDFRFTFRPKGRGIKPKDIKSAVEEIKLLDENTLHSLVFFDYGGS